MQQISLFEIGKKSIRRGNLEFISEVLFDNIYIATLSVPSGKFIIRYSLKDNLISEFEILDYTGYMYITKGLIKNIKCLVQALFNSLK